MKPCLLLSFKNGSWLLRFVRGVPAEKCIRSIPHTRHEMSDPYARYALRNDRAPEGDLRREEFESEVSSQWFTPQADRKLVKSLMKRSDRTALANYGLWIALMVASGVGGYLTWGTWWTVPSFVVYGVLYS